MGGDSKKATNNIFVYFLIKDPSPPHREAPETGRAWLRFPSEPEQCSQPSSGCCQAASSRSFVFCPLNPTQKLSYLQTSQFVGHLCPGPYNIVLCVASSFIELTHVALKRQATQGRS